MELEVITMCAAAAADPTIGINAMLDTVGVLPGHTTPARVHVYNSMDHGWVARRKVTNQLLSEIDLPALAVFCILDSEMKNVSTVIRDGHLNVCFAYLQKEADTSKGKRDAAYVNRATQRFLARFINPANGALRSLNGVQIIHDPANKLPQNTDAWEAAIVMASSVVTFAARDTNAYGS